MKHTTVTAVNLSNAARKGDGDFYATKSALGRFCTEAVINVAQEAVEGMSLAERAKFVSGITPWTHWDRDLAIETLCGWTSSVKLREWSLAFEASLRAAQQEFPFAIEQLGASL